MKLTIQKGHNNWSIYLDKLWTIFITYTTVVEVVHHGWDVWAIVMSVLLALDVVTDIAWKLQERNDEEDKADETA